MVAHGSSFEDEYVVSSSPGGKRLRKRATFVKNALYMDGKDSNGKNVELVITPGRKFMVLVPNRDEAAYMSKMLALDHTERVVCRIAKKRRMVLKQYVMVEDVE